MSRVKAALRVVMAIAYVGLGLNHFIDTEFYVAIMPPFIPFHVAMVYISGVAEIGLGLLVLPASTRRLAGFGLIALLIAVFPANLYMAFGDVLINGEPAGPKWALYLRLPIQLVLIAWAWWVTTPDRDQAPGSSTS